MKITHVTVKDLRFPTSRDFSGSDAMNPDPDYSAAYVILHTDGALEGHGLTFTIGRGNDLVCAAVQAIAGRLVGRSLADLTRDMGAFWHELTGDSQMRWLGPDKGVVHLATGAVVNAVWDLWAKAEGKPLWKLLVDLTPEELVRCLDFRYVTDALTPEEALALLREARPGVEDREAHLRARGYPAYTTSAGWLGYSDEKVRRLTQEALDAGFGGFKIKVGRDLESDRRRAAIVRDVIGPDRALMVDANQVWEVEEAIEYSRQLLDFRPLWVEEPTSPDDLLGHARIDAALREAGTRVATGEMLQNRLMFKQLLQLDGIGYAQIDACRVGGVNENLLIILLAAKFGVKVCPHAGGVGLCEYVQHLSMWDYVSVSGSLEGRFTEYVDHLHEHFLDPVRIERGHYLAPIRPGYSIEMHAQTLLDYRYPDGPVWTQEHRPQEVQP
ncbi:L-fuconate dehydratase (plasmid) [Deinococcus metallilatus]|uniref:L-fuconate dehydratase n=1 Tax=Deinococcus metallilatus TaxID=1211322 RepID=A0AAJ5JZM8_9DEIO|nr:L-fuconate dehydratase [Deinococcus metallilatus]MBB5293507.1 L-fuconate dehydratase [Deinococcus metallilatus]QBY06586.1 L-fuconate dehydratase [Deinococcus metallilatus]RXJ17929.1 L-fuconate dehydratase [Deinococcus metallilatus]TLK32200.1 L-fuconate dehydratase [Deinococcus metallilatus]GMA15273.1 L-fuconate dehydratase [Deinococcus metallilatus]